MPFRKPGNTMWEMVKCDSCAALFEVWWEVRALPMNGSDNGLQNLDWMHPCDPGEIQGMKLTQEGKQKHCS
eukprot:CAMPEP_0174363804 /NCGR_PEP_ID=MMETSP0811_2-20130205/70271_1 /TAXON_ID=73025 ORGANISM="Eutreptiella gymnastica-like, Strain CCMP1594" /NCGR_SAMPLE_ID=MMETSP0811_2 /ASSEMBLY_ACC=CAM_ASM_000667 /LENGTH=70 /DNA_ID=CAMNT_0015502825 /DNA_START=139 /DNA_END=348 /DNA_ORIENTATION=+